MNNIVKVDMIPKSFGVNTLSCSQGDTKREFKFTLNDANGAIDTSDVEIVLPQFPVYKGGTEEILPTNGSVPSTAPIIADIQYPQGLLTDQEFTYRQSPTEEDGLAKITDIKGNTLVWNQLVSGQYSHTFTAGGSNQNVNIERIDNIVAGHKYLYAITQANSMSSNVRNTLQYLYSNGSNVTVNESNASNHNLNAGRYGWIFTAPTDNANKWISLYYWCHTPNVAVTIKDAILVDLTLMFGAGKEPTVNEFNSLFPLPYYSYQSTLLPFKGTGIKTTGANLIDSVEQGTIDPWSREGSAFPAPSNTRVRTPFIYLEKGDYTITSQNGFPTVIDIYRSNAYNTYDIDVSFPTWQTTPKTFTMPYDGYVIILFKRTDDTNITPSDITGERMYNNNTESVTDLPILNYFPTGMKSAGNVYDELTESKAITRVGAVDLGTLNWSYAGGGTTNARFVGDVLSDASLPSSGSIVANATCSKYVIVTEGQVYNNQKVGLCIITTGRPMVYDPNFSDATTFKTAMSGVYLYYELKTPTETSFTTASLVTENGEIQLLPHGDYLVGTVNSSVSRKSGMFDAKVKLTDGDGTVYSNKLQLYVERSPK